MSKDENDEKTPDYAVCLDLAKKEVAKLGIGNAGQALEDTPLQKALPFLGLADEGDTIPAIYKKQFAAANPDFSLFLGERNLGMPDTSIVRVMNLVENTRDVQGHYVPVVFSYNENGILSDVEIINAIIGAETEISSFRNQQNPHAQPKWIRDFQENLRKYTTINNLEVNYATKSPVKGCIMQRGGRRVLWYYSNHKCSAIN